MILDINLFLSEQEEKTFNYKEYYHELKLYEERNDLKIKEYNEMKELKKSLTKSKMLLNYGFIQEYKNELINRMLIKYK